jgi:hypothetical protein
MITHTGTTYTAENEFALYIKLQRRGSMKYEGKLYVSENDYAVPTRGVHAKEGEN